MVRRAFGLNLQVQLPEYFFMRTQEKSSIETSRPDPRVLHAPNCMDTALMHPRHSNHPPKVAPSYRLYNLGFRV